MAMYEVKDAVSVLCRINPQDTGTWQDGFVMEDPGMNFVLVQGPNFLGWFLRDHVTPRKEEPTKDADSELETRPRFSGNQRCTTVSAGT